MHIDDHYSDPPLLRRWHLIDGRPVCVLPAVEPWALPALDVAGIIAENAVVRTTVEIVEGYEAALRLSAGEEPPATVPSLDAETGEPVEVANPAHADWQAAVDLVSATDPTIVVLAKIRAGEPIDEDADGSPVYAEPDPLPADPFTDLESVPFQVAPLDGYRVLIQMELDQEVETLLAGMTPAARGEWERAKWWRRDNPVLGALAAALELSREEVNQLFRYAAQA